MGCSVLTAWEVSWLPSRTNRFGGWLERKKGRFWGTGAIASVLRSVPRDVPVTFLATRAFHESHRSRTRRGRAPSPDSFCLGPYFTGEQIPIGRATAENQELGAILNELSK